METAWSWIWDIILMSHDNFLLCLHLSFLFVRITLDRDINDSPFLPLQLLEDTKLIGFLHYSTPHYLVMHCKTLKAYYMSFCDTFLLELCRIGAGYAVLYTTLSVNLGLSALPGLTS